MARAAPGLTDHVGETCRLRVDGGDCPSNGAGEALLPPPTPSEYLTDAERQRLTQDDTEEAVRLNGSTPSSGAAQAVVNGQSGVRRPLVNRC